jgi:hypothetical protein
MSSQARKQRRAYEKFLKKTNPTAYKEWKSESIKRGNEIHQANVESVRKSEEAYYESQQTKIISQLREEGKTNEEIDSFIAKWVQTIKVWGSDERPKRWRELNREVA